MPHQAKRKHALSVDVEDFFQVSALASAIDPGEWEAYDSGRVVKNTQRLLNLFDQFGHKATFFVLGWIAERYPSLVQEIHSRGHEVASHGYSHQLIYRQTPETFREETQRSKQILEDCIGAEVIGYRAASYSITPESEWALDILYELGFKYDSSLFPVKHDRYGMPDAAPHPHVRKTPGGHNLPEFSLTSLDLFGYRLPIAGGGYFRLFPYVFFEWCLRKYSSSTDQPFVFYLHPWEIDPEQPRVSGISWLSKFRHYNNLHRCESRLIKLLKQFEFTDLKTVLQEQDLLLSPVQ